MRRRNWKQWLCKILFGEGCVPFTQITLVGWVYYGQCENSELKSRESALMDTGTPHKLKDYFENDNDYFINAFYKRWQTSRQFFHATRVGILRLHTNNFMTAGNIMLLRTASNASENMAASGWLASCDTGTKVTLGKRASPAHNLFSRNAICCLPF